MTAATTLRRARCLIGGHPDSLVQWGAWKSDEECGRYRVLTKRCARCNAVIATRLLMETDLWPRRAS